MRRLAVCAWLALAATAHAEDARRTVFILQSPPEGATVPSRITPLAWVAGKKFLPPPHREIWGQLQPEEEAKSQQTPAVREFNAAYYLTGARYGVFQDGVRVATATVVAPDVDEGNGVGARVTVEGRLAPGQAYLAADFDPGPPKAVRRETTPEEARALGRLTQLIFKEKGAEPALMARAAQALTPGPGKTGRDRGETASFDLGGGAQSAHAVSLDLRDDGDADCWLVNLVIEREGKVYEPTLRDAAFHRRPECEHESTPFFMSSFDFDGDGKIELVFGDGQFTVVYRKDGAAWREAFRDWIEYPL